MNIKLDEPLVHVYTRAVDACGRVRAYLLD